MPQNGHFQKQEKYWVPNGHFRKKEKYWVGGVLTGCILFDYFLDFIRNKNRYEKKTYADLLKTQNGRIFSC